MSKDFIIYDREHMEKGLIKAFARDSGWNTGTCYVEWVYDEDNCITHAKVVREQTKAEKPLRWVTANGRVLEIPAMETSHLKNAQAWLIETFLPFQEQDSAEWLWGIAMIVAMNNELKKRTT